MRLKQLDPKLTQQRMARLDAIDAAVGRLQVQMEEVIARLDRYDERLIAPYLPIIMQRAYRPYGCPRDVSWMNIWLVKAC